MTCAKHDIKIGKHEKTIDLLIFAPTVTAAHYTKDYKRESPINSHSSKVAAITHIGLCHAQYWFLATNG